MKTIYIAGPISATNCIDYLINVRSGIKVATFLLKEGYAPFCPHMDFQLGLCDHIPLAQYYAYSIAWLRKSDMIYFMPGWEGSAGCQEEYNVAAELKIPIYFDIRDIPK